MSTHAVAVAATLLCAAASGCAGVAPRIVYSPQELREEVARRAPAFPADEIVVPFEVGEPYLSKARALVERSRTVRESVQALLAALFDRSAFGFGLRYSPRAATAGARETLARGEGNCLDLASIFIGLSRELGLRAYYLDASRRVHETRDGGDGITVNAGHITAMVETETGKVGLDFSREGEILAYRVISDVEALAHFYNNRGYERIDEAEEARVAPDWALAARDFERAVQVDPDFARAWNNLGIAAARLGRADEAASDYRAAMAHDASFAAPHNNLGLLLLSRGDATAAVHELEAAAALAPKAYNTQYVLAVARLQQGDRDGARLAARRAIDLRGAYPEAEALLRSMQ